jgi:hypothetical protein
MNSSTIVLLAAVIVLIGKWSQGKKVNATIIVGGIFAALMISMMDSAAPSLAKGFAYLFLVTAFLTYANDIFKGVGI